jgi:hypothetical protein
MTVVNTLDLGLATMIAGDGQTHLLLVWRKLERIIGGKKQLGDRE